ncbi:MAG: hypothetical protein ACFE8E_10560 [Candidatus Hodarchaeota archaeon]
MKSKREIRVISLILITVCGQILLGLMLSNRNDDSGANRLLKNDETLFNEEVPQAAYSDLWEPNGTVVCDATNDQDYPRLIYDGIGGTIIIWEDPRNDVDIDIFAQKIDIDGNTAWTTNGVRISTLSTDDLDYQLVSDGAGGAIITWSTSTDNIYAQHINSSGTLQWGNGIELTNAPGSQLEPQIISDGEGGAIITWYDSRSLSEYDIYVQRIHAGSLLWGAGGTLICNATDNQVRTKLTSDGVGGAIITWCDSRSGTNVDIYAQKINSAGVVQWIENGVIICNASDTQNYQQIVSDGRGGSIITWNDRRNIGINGWDIYAQRVNSTGNVQWDSNGIAVCTHSNQQNYPKIVQDGMGGAVICWYDDRIPGDAIFAQRISHDGEILWTVDGVQTCLGIGEYDCTTDGAGGAFITWEDYNNYGDTHCDVRIQWINAHGLIQYTLSGKPVCNVNEPQYFPEISYDGCGGAFITWIDRRSGAYDIYAQKVQTNKVIYWPSNNSAVHTDRYGETHPAITPDGSGGAIISCNVEGGIWSQYVDADGIIQWGINGEFLGSGLNPQTTPRSVSDGAGGAIFTWHSYYYADNNIYAQCLGPDGNSRWPNLVDVCTSSGAQIFPQLTSDGMGGAIIAWRDYRSGTYYGIYYQRISSSGDVLWTTDGVMLSSSSTDENLQIASDGKGGAIITWQQSNNIRAQRINSNGGILWGVGGRLIASGNSNEMNPQIIPDNKGGAIITWHDDRGGSGYDIYAQRVGSDGIVQWTVDGELISSGALDQTHPQIVPDEVGGAIITWQDFRSGTDWDIYAQKVNSAGDLQWDINGVVISEENNDQSSVQLVSDAAGGAILTWHDFRSGTDWDIYSQRITLSGINKWKEGGVAISSFNHDQKNPQIAKDGTGGAIIVWEDFRNGDNFDIYAQLVKDSIPEISIISPISHDICGPSPPPYSLDYICPFMDKIWYTLNDGEKNIVLSTDGTINQLKWENIPNGSVSIKFYINNSLGGLVSQEVKIFKDFIKPYVHLSAPHSYELYGTNPPSFNFFASDENGIARMWYTFDLGTTIEEFLSNGTIAQNIWNLQGNGTISIRFYANDTVGNINWEETVVRKDILGPIITINAPIINEEFELAPSYDLSINEGNLDKIWYTLDGGITNITITSLSGTIDRSIWQGISIGTLTLRFYANDTLGNLGWKDVFIYKISPQQGGIPVEWLLLIIVSFGGVVLVTITLLIARPKMRKSKYRKKLKIIAKEELERFKSKMNEFIITKLKEQYEDEWWDKGIPDEIKNQIDKIKQFKGKK